MLMTLAPLPAVRGNSHWRFFLKLPNLMVLGLAFFSCDKCVNQYDCYNLPVRVIV